MDLLRTLRQIAIASSLLACLGGPLQAEGVLRVGVDTAYPPFSEIKPDGSMAGFDIDFANLVCARMNKTCEFVSIEWDGIIPGLLANKFDVIISSMGINEERTKQVDFTKRYYYTTASLIAKKNAGFTADEAGTAGHSVGVLRASAHECYIAAHMPKADMRQYTTTDEAFLDLQAGRIDSILVDTIPGDAWLASDPANPETFAPISSDLYDQTCFGEGAGIALRKNEEDLKAALNAAIDKTREDGSYLALSNKYFGHDIYGPAE